MPSTKPVLMPTLIQLVLFGAKSQPVEISTILLAQKIGRSQQAASQHLLELEDEGYIERTRIGMKSYVKLTEKGLSVINELYLSVASHLEEKQTHVDIHGELFTGLGEGAYYVSIQGYMEQFKTKLGWEPYHGTLNLRMRTSLDRKLRSDLRSHPAIEITGFVDDKRTYGWVKCLPAEVNGKIKVAVFSAFERTHYDDSVLEVLAPVKVREVLKLREGETITVRVFL